MKLVFIYARASRRSVEHLLNWTLPVILFVIDTIVVLRSNVVTFAGTILKWGFLRNSNIDLFII